MSNEGKEMVKAEPAELATQSMGVEGLVGMDSSDLIIPRLSVVQPTSAAVHEGARPGRFRNNLSGECVETLRIVPLLMRKGRIMFEEGADRPVCRSNDSKVPASWIDIPKANDCTACGYAKWVNNEKPACNLVYNLLALDPVTERPFAMTLKGSSVKSGKQLISLGTYMGREMYTWSIDMGLVLREGKTGSKWYEVTFTDQRDVEPADKYLGVYEDMKAHARDEAKPAPADDDMPF